LNLPLPGDLQIMKDKFGDITEQLKSEFSLKFGDYHKWMDDSQMSQNFFHIDITGFSDEANIQQCCGSA
jgi:hypothetical protein